MILCFWKYFCDSRGLIHTTQIIRFKHGRVTSQYKIIFNKIVIQNGDQKGIADNSNNINCIQSNNNNNGQSNDNNNHYLAHNAKQNAEIIIIGA